MERSKLILFPVMLFLFSVSLLCAPVFLAAQDAGYIIDYTEEQPRIIQTLVWENDEYSMYYNVQIQFFHEEGYDESKGLPSGYYEHLTTTITDNFIEVSLTPGRYRYNVTPYDFLGRQGESSGWIEFEIIEAYRPVIERYLPQAFYLDQKTERALHIRGFNLFEESQVFLRSSAQDVRPIKIDTPNENRMTLFFDDETLPAGVYDIYIVNPGGIESITKDFTIGYQKWVDIFLKTIYTPIIPVYGQLNEIFTGGAYFAGASFAIEFIFSKRTIITGGIEVSYSAFSLNDALSFKSDFNGILNGFSGISDGIFFQDINFNIVMQKRFFQRRMAVSFRFGAGVTVAKGSGTYEVNDITAHFNLSLSYIILLLNGFNLEFGADLYNYSTGIFAGFSDGGNFSGVIKPRLAMVWQF